MKTTNRKPRGSRLPTFLRVGIKTCSLPRPFQEFLIAVRCAYYFVNDPKQHVHEHQIDLQYALNINKYLETLSAPKPSTVPLEVLVRALSYLYLWMKLAAGHLRFLLLYCARIRRCLVAYTCSCQVHVSEGFELQKAFRSSLHGHSQSLV